VHPGSALFAVLSTYTMIYSGGSQSTNLLSRLVVRVISGRQGYSLQMIHWHSSMTQIPRLSRPGCHLAKSLSTTHILPCIS
jgi:hypothetical protein